MVGFKSRMRLVALCLISFSIFSGEVGTRALHAYNNNSSRALFSAKKTNFASLRNQKIVSAERFLIECEQNLRHNGYSEAVQYFISHLASFPGAILFLLSNNHMLENTHNKQIFFHFMYS